MSQLPILTLTLNPALDMATEVHELIPGHKLRCAEPLLDPGGGGLNVSRAIKALGGDSLALVAIGGLTGDRLAGLIRAEGVTFLSILGPGETRQSLTVNEATTGKQYRFMLPGPVWGEAERARVFTLLRATARPGGLSVISGSQPPGVPVDFPAQLAASMPEARVVLDTSGSTLTEAVRHPIPGLEVLRMDGPEGEGNVLADTDQRLFSKAAKVRVKSTVGAGDSFVAAFVLALSRGQSHAEALALGSAAASAAVTTDATQLCRPEDVMRLLPECAVRDV
jgi:6-phosphofructokinase 2